MVSKAGPTAARADLHTAVYGFAGDVRSDYRNLSEMKRDPKVSIFEFGFDQRTSAPGASVLASSRKMIPDGFRCAVSMTDAGVELANALNREFADEVLVSHAIRVPMVDKSAIYKHLLASGVKVPSFEVAENVERLPQAINAFKLQKADLILKPVRGERAHIVYRPRLDESTDDIVRTLRSKLSSSEDASVDEPIIVMEYISWDGKPVEIAVDGVVVGGRVLFSQVHEKIQQSTGFTFKDKMMVCPPITSEILTRVDEIRSIAQVVISALRHESGVFHIEMRLTEKDAFVIDCSLRPGGGFIPHAVERRSKVDLRYAHVRSHFTDLDDTILGNLTDVGGTCIGVLYASPESSITNASLTALQGRLNEQDVFAANVRTSLVQDPLWKPDLAVSVGFHADTAEQAAQKFLDLKASFLME